MIDSLKEKTPSGLPSELGWIGAILDAQRKAMLIASNGASLGAHEFSLSKLIPLLALGSASRAGRCSPRTE